MIESINMTHILRREGKIYVNVLFWYSNTGCVSKWCLYLIAGFYLKHATKVNSVLNIKKFEKKSLTLFEISQNLKQNLNSVVHITYRTYHQSVQVCACTHQTYYKKIGVLFLGKCGSSKIKYRTVPNIWCQSLKNCF